jgi:hypothetical protein
LNKENVISDEVLLEAQRAARKLNCWFIYNQENYFLVKDDCYFFRNRKEAIEFIAEDKIGKERFRLIYFESMADLVRQISYGEALKQKLFNSKK